MFLLAEILTSVLLLHLLQAKLVHSGAQVRIRFRYYDNPRGLDYNSKKCDFGIFQAECDPFFTISVTIDGYTYRPIRTNRVKDQNTVQFRDKIVDIANPLLYNVNQFQGYVSITVNVDDYDPIGNDHIGSVHYTVMPPMRPAPFQSPDVPLELRLTDNGKAKSVLVIQISAQCHTNYYGPNCSQYCLAASDSSSGFYTCGSAGNKVCLDTYDPQTDCKKTFCDQKPCQNGGTCHNTFAGFNCACLSLFGGPTCADRLSACESGKPCKNGGTCRSGTGHSGCDCPPGFAGPFCEEDVNECIKDKPCKGNGSRCENWIGSYSCQCENGWTGRNCTEDVDECTEEYRYPLGNSTEIASADICYNGGVCENLPGSFYCRCPDGFQGTQCEVDIDECQNGTELCNQRTQLCQNLEGSFACLCRPHYFGPNCTGLFSDRFHQETRAWDLLWILLPISLLILCVLIEVRFRCLRNFLNLANCRFDSTVSRRLSESTRYSGADNPIYEVTDEATPYEEPSEVNARQVQNLSHPPPLPPPRVTAPGTASLPDEYVEPSHPQPGVSNRVTMAMLVSSNTFY